MRRLAAFASAFAFALAFAACAGDSGGPSPDAGLRQLPARMEVVNRSQYVLRELRLHREPNYLGAVNVLPFQLAIDGTYLHVGSGSWYVTVFREKYQDGPILAFTTGYPVRLFDDHGYRLEVQDMSFRLTEDPSLAPRADAGMSDADVMDAAGFDAAGFDAAGFDAAVFDAGFHDAGPRDAGTSD